MKKFFLAAVFTAVSFIFNNHPVQAQSTCQYDSTQARVQKDINGPWKKSVEVRCGESFNVGSFHNQTGQFATDTKIEVSGTDYTGKPFYTTATNGQRITLPEYAKGTFNVKVTTPGQTGYDCRQTARVYVSCNKPQACQYDSTQARVQKSINDPWEKSLTISCNESFRVGSFHNKTDQLAGDTSLTLYGIRTDGSTEYRQLSNEDTVSGLPEGTYKVYVSTNNQYGYDCRASARVRVRCDQQEEPEEPENPTSCQYTSTQARVQKDINDPWKQYLPLVDSNNFNVGSFHNETGHFATDTKLEVEGPSMAKREYRNGDRVTADRLGLYTLQVTTHNQTGEACKATAYAYIFPG